MNAGRVVRRVRMSVGQIRAGGFREVAADLQRWAWSENHAIGLRRELAVEPSPPSPPSLVPLRAERINEEMAARIFVFDGLSSIDRLYLERRRNIYDSGFRGGWCAVDDEGEPAYVQWLIPGEDADAVHEFFPSLFPQLEADTLFIEGAWIPPSFRKRKVMGEGLALVTQAAADTTPGARFAVAFVAEENRGAAFGTRSAGYAVFMKRTERWRFGRRVTTFVAASEDDFEIFRAAKRVSSAA